VSRASWHLSRIAIFGGIWFLLQLFVGRWWAWPIMAAPYLALGAYLGFITIRQRIEKKRSEARRRRLWSAPDPWRG
jgi:hypothetical protein